MRRLRPTWISLLGAGLLVTGFVYEIIFTGVPDQDPTPEMIARWAFHAQVANILYGAGLLTALAGTALTLARRAPPPDR